MFLVVKVSRIFMLHLQTNFSFVLFNVCFLDVHHDMRVITGKILLVGEFIWVGVSNFVRMVSHIHRLMVFHLCHLPQLIALVTYHPYVLLYPIPRTTNMSFISCNWEYKTKYNSHESIERHKVGLVVRGNHQQVSRFWKTCSSVVKFTTICLIWRVAFSQHWLIWEPNIKNAFLHGHLQERFLCNSLLGCPSQISLSFVPFSLLYL